MLLQRSLPLALGLGLLLSAGCSGRNSSVELDQLRSDNSRMAQELGALYNENAQLKFQRDSARDDLALQRATTEGLEKQLKAIGTSGSGSSLINEGWQVDKDGSISLPDDFAFNKGSADLNQDGQRAVRSLAKVLQSADYAGTKVFVIGHTDNTPVVRAETKTKFTDNWGLSAMRSASVVRELEAAGISPGRLIGTFRGQHVPRADNKTNDGKAQNRRVNIQVSL